MRWAVLPSRWPSSWSKRASGSSTKRKGGGRERVLGPKTSCIEGCSGPALWACRSNQLKFRYVLSDVWYSASENMKYIKEELEKEFIMPLKSNRKVALSLEDKQRGLYERVGSVEPEPNTVIEKVYVEQVGFGADFVALLLCKQVFKNEDGSEGVLYLVSSDLTLDYERMTTIYQRRWKVEEYHKSLGSNASLAKSPTKTIRTQSNHVFASIWAFVKLERMKLITGMNHFALRSRLCVKAVQAAFRELQDLRLPQVSA